MSKLVEFLRQKAEQRSEEQRQEQIKEKQRIQDLHSFLAQIRSWLSEAEEEGLLTIGMQERIIGTQFTTQTPVLVINTPDRQIEIIPQENELGRVGVQIGRGGKRADLWLLQDEQTGKKRWVDYSSEAKEEVTREHFEELLMDQLS
jgi:hypothetical protein